MKKIEKIWPKYLRTNPEPYQIKSVKELIEEHYPDFGVAYRSGLIRSKFDSLQADFLIDVFHCESWELFEDVMDYPMFKKEPEFEDEKIEKPERYTGKSGMQVFDVINEFGLDFYEGNTLKYLIRYKDKNGVEDLEKAKVYIDELIRRFNDGKKYYIVFEYKNGEKSYVPPMHDTNLISYQFLITDKSRSAFGSRKSAEYMLNEFIRFCGLSEEDAKRLTIVEEGN